MPLVTSNEMLTRAMKESYAVGAFNANNLEMIQGILEAAEEEQAPVILQASQGAIKYAGLANIVALVTNGAKEARIPVVLHLDHGTDFDQNVKCLLMGFTSLMFDGSSLPFEENVRITKKVVEIAHAAGIPVEGEIGRIGVREDCNRRERRRSAEIAKDCSEPQDLTEPEDALRFVQATGVDSVAVAVGSTHKMKEQKAKLDQDRIARIARLVKIPLVLHGASGVPDDEAGEAISRGVCKVNIATRLNMAFVEGIKAAIDKDPDQVDPRKILNVGKAYLKKAVKQKIRLFGCQGKGV
jgi:fructose-bisphosphate aldolase class II